MDIPDDCKETARRILERYKEVQGSRGEKRPSQDHPESDKSIRRNTSGVTLLPIIANSDVNASKEAVGMVPAFLPSTENMNGKVRKGGGTGTIVFSANNQQIIHIMERNESWQQ